MGSIVIERVGDTASAFATPPREFKFKRFRKCFQADRTVCARINDQLTDVLAASTGKSAHSVRQVLTAYTSEQWKNRPYCIQHRRTECSNLRQLLESAL